MSEWSRRKLTAEQKVARSVYNLAYLKSRSARNRAYNIGLKVERGCDIIGCEVREPYMLDWHHIRGVKVRDICQLLRRGVSFETLDEEIAKCVLLCANHHRMAHHEPEKFERLLNS